MNDERKIPTDSAAVDNNALTPGRLEAIWVKRARGGKMDAAQQVTLAAKKGIVGNANWGGWRQVTIM